MDEEKPAPGALTVASAVRLSRRHVVLGLGGGAFVVAALAACSGSSSGGGSSGGTSGGSPGAGSASSAATGDASQPAPAPSSSGASAAPAGSGGELAWQRVDLGFVSAYVLVRGGRAAVVDTGVQGSADAIGAVLDAAGPGWSGVDYVVLTHMHPDHAGSIGEVLGRATSATGWIGEADLSSVSAPRALKALADGDEVFGLTVVGTPGHTAGHVSVFDPGAGVLLAGDALTNTAGLAGSNPQFTADPAAAAASVAKLAGLPVRTILFGHGEPMTSGAAAALKALAAKG